MFPLSTYRWVFRAQALINLVGSVVPMLISWLVIILLQLQKWAYDWQLSCYAAEILISSNIIGAPLFLFNDETQWPSWYLIEKESDMSTLIISKPRCQLLQVCRSYQDPTSMLKTEKKQVCGPLDSKTQVDIFFLKKRLPFPAWLLYFLSFCGKNTFQVKSRKRSTSPPACKKCKKMKVCFGKQN